MSGLIVDALPSAVLAALERSRAYGFLGPGPLAPHIEQAAAFASILTEHGIATGRVGDLGAGGGVPGLVVAALLPQLRVAYLDANERRMAFVRDVVEDLGWSGRCTVEIDRAEVLGRRTDLRGVFDGVIARGFAAPTVTAECAAPLLRTGGLLVVSDPPEDVERWPTAGLQEFGLLGERLQHESFAFFVGRLVGSCPDRYPRRVGVPSKRPVF